MLFSTMIYKMIQAAALGMTCQDAFNVFSQNETLRLQSRVYELESRLAKYEPVQQPLRRFENYDHYDRVRDSGFDYLIDWLHKNVKACTFRAFDFEDMHAVCDIYSFIEAIKHCIFIITGCKNFSDGLSDRCFEVSRAACQAAHFLSLQTHHATQETWCEDQKLVVRVIIRSLDLFISEQLIDAGAVDWSDDSIDD